MTIQEKAECLRMPGAMCGLWGICGAITSIGAALAIIDGTTVNRWYLGKSYAIYIQCNW